MGCGWAAGGGWDGWWGGRWRGGPPRGGRCRSRSSLLPKPSPPPASSRRAPRFMCTQHPPENQRFWLYGRCKTHTSHRPPPCHHRRIPPICGVGSGHLPRPLRQLSNPPSGTRNDGREPPHCHPQHPQPHGAPAFPPPLSDRRLLTWHQQRPSPGCLGGQGGLQKVWGPSEQRNARGVVHCQARRVHLCTLVLLGGYRGTSQKKSQLTSGRQSRRTCASLTTADRSLGQYH